MGPNRDAVWTEDGIVEKFPASGPKKLWSVEIGGGYAGPAVAGGKVYVTDRQVGMGQKNPANPFDNKSAVNGTERVLCFDARTGKELWKHEYPCEYRVSFGAGPRCTPTVLAGKVYSLGTMGDLVCLNAETGSLIWKKDFKKDYKAQTPMWGFCGHPLVVGETVVCLVGGEGALVVAFNAATGSEIWKALSPARSGDAGYAPPTLLQLNGIEQIVQYHPTGVTGLNPKTGAVLWSVKMDPGQYGMSIMAPRVSDNRLFAASEEAMAAFEMKPGAPPAELWRGNRKSARGLNPVNMTPFIEGNVIYGVDQPGMLRAVELATGKRLWYTFEPVLDEEKDENFKGAGSGTAFLVKHEPTGRFFIFNEKGSLVIARLTREGPRTIDRAKLVEATGAAFGRKVVWSHPAYADKCIFVRNDKVLACFSLAKE
jgi:outer membrane protein assembly factor BamB